jgi:hypothetical protein
VNFFRPKIVVESSDQTLWEQRPPSESFFSRRKKAALERNQTRLQRDIARGYAAALQLPFA